MKFAIPALFAATVVLTLPFADRAFANNDEDAQIQQCIDDNANEGQSDETLTAYCQCASGKINDFSQSITAWEKHNADEQEACSKEAGWKY